MDHRLCESTCAGPEGLHLQSHFNTYEGQEHYPYHQIYFWFLMEGYYWVRWRGQLCVAKYYELHDDWSVFTQHGPVPVPAVDKVEERIF
jgi:hypothetical protein